MLWLLRQHIFQFLMRLNFAKYTSLHQQHSKSLTYYNKYIIFALVFDVRTDNSQLVSHYIQHRTCVTVKNAATTITYK
jgi:hypothetical protein